nr:hypothetical protein [Halomonas salinarum]
MSQKHQIHDASDDANEEMDAFMDAVNDSQYAPSRSSRAETLQARRRLETLLEERRLQRAIEDDWNLDDEEDE